MSNKFESNVKTVYTTDLKFFGLNGAIAAYLIPHQQGVALVECGPGSTIPALLDGLHALGYQATDVTDVLLTHIHLDHAGAAGWFAQQGALIHVHPVGAPHMLDPEKLLASARRIYGDMMETLWGEFLPVPAERIHIPEDNQVIEINELRFRTINTPGHANHHYAYLFENTCFTGDIGGVRMQGTKHLRVPMPPPEFHLELWRESLAKLLSEYQRGAFSRVAPTHYGTFDDAGWHISAMLDALDEIDAWLQEVMPGDPTVEALNNQFMSWTHKRAQASGLDDARIQAYEAANPSWMSAHGMARYWKKHRM